MMKIMIFGILVTLIQILSNHEVHAKELVYRPITLTILDADTKQPLEGISVTVVNVAFYSKPLWYWFIPIDTTSDFVYRMYKYETNKNGVVEIPRSVYKVGFYHFLLNQKIVLNIELVDKSISIYEQAEIFDFIGFYANQDRGFFFRLRPEYKAGFIYCYADSEDYELFEKGKPYMTVMPRKYKIAKNERNQTSFFCDHENITFYLERFIEQAEP